MFAVACTILALQLVITDIKADRPVAKRQADIHSASSITSGLLINGVDLLDQRIEYHYQCLLRVAAEEGGNSTLVGVSPPPILTDSMTLQRTRFLNQKIAMDGKLYSSILNVINIIESFDCIDSFD